MPVTRLTRRRRSSLGIGLSHVKPGNYGIATSPRAVTFAPNVTPGTYVEDTDGVDDMDELSSPTDALFPPAETPAPVSSRRRVPPGKRRSQGYIPRPPNAFMLFRADFVRQKHVPGSIETNHGSLSKIIGNCWQALPEEEKKHWVKQAKIKKAEHRQMYPNYRFRPVHNKNKAAAKRKEKVIDTPDERRCEEVAALLLEGKKGDELAAAVRALDLQNLRDWNASTSPPPPYSTLAMPTPLYAQRRPSSVPPSSTSYNQISIPSVPFFPSAHSLSRPDSPVGNIARSNRFMFAQRRASSTGPGYYGGYSMPQTFTSMHLQPDDEPLPDVNTELFNTSFAFGFDASHGQNNFFNCTTEANPNLAVSISPLDHLNVESDSLSAGSSCMSSTYPYSATTPADQHQSLDPWLQHHFNEMTPSASPSAFSVSPSIAPSEVAPMIDNGMGMYAPQPEHASHFQGWSDPMQHIPGMEAISANHADMGLGLQHGMGYIDMQTNMHLQNYACGLEQAEIYGAEDAQGYSVLHQELGFTLEPQHY